MKIKIYDLEQRGWKVVAEVPNNIRIEGDNGTSIDITQDQYQEGLQIRTINHRIIVQPNTSNVITVREEK